MVRRARNALKIAVCSLITLCNAQVQAQNTGPIVLNWTFDGTEGHASNQIYHTQFPKPDFVPGVHGQAWRSDGFSSFVAAPATLSASAGFTVQGWVALESYPSGYEQPIDSLIPASIFQQATKHAGFDVFIDAFGRWGLRVSTVSGTLNAQAKSDFPLNRWVHVAASYDPLTGEAKLFADGALVASAQRRPAAFKSAESDFEIAHSWRAAPMGVFNINGLNAAYDDISLTAAAISLDQIALANKGFTPPSAAASLKVPASRFASDLQRPVYHAIPPANWTNEPHGLIRRGQTWHLFYQRTPNGPYKTMMTWGHMRSDDLVHWTDLPIMLRPELQTQDFGFDMKGIWSGDVVTGPNGWAFAFYTSVNYSPHFYNPGISLAISDDPDLLHWQKAGPLIDSTGFRDFRDPYVWFNNDEARMIVGATMGSDGRSDGGGLAYYRCADLAIRSCWHKQPPIAPFAKMYFGSDIWEMPVFAKISDRKYILEANPIGDKISKYGNRSTRAVYWIGSWDGTSFHPESMAAKMLDVLPGHLSPTVARNVDGSLIGIGIVDERRTPVAQLHAGWANTFSLPRVWRLMPDGQTLGQSPLPALMQLRQNAGAISTTLAGTGEQIAGNLGRAVEIEAHFDTPPASGAYGIVLGASNDKSEVTRLIYDPAKHEVVLDKRYSTLAKDGEGPMELHGAYDDAAFGWPSDFHVFIDHSVIDVFINNAAALSFRIYPIRDDSSQFGITSTKPTRATIKAWRLNPAPVQ